MSEAVTGSHESNGDGHDADTARLRHEIDHAAHLLPAQGPITVFIHHNTLHAFEDRPFEQGIEEGGRVFGCQPYLSEDRYREAMSKGRILLTELDDVLRQDLGASGDESVAGLCSRFELRRAMLQYPIRSGTADELLWCVADTDVLRRFRPEASAALRSRLVAQTRRWVMRDLRGGGEGPSGRGRGPRPAWTRELFAAFGERDIETWPEENWEAFTLQTLWQVCREGVRGVPAFAAPEPLPARHTELLRRAATVDTDAWVHEVLVRFTAAYLDQGVSHWPLPDREAGFFECFCSVYREPGGPPRRWMAGLAGELATLQDGRVPALESVRRSLDALGVGEAELGQFLSETFLALRGWGGMVHEVEIRRDRVAVPIPEGSLVGFLAVRLILDRFALAYAAKDRLGIRGPLAELRDECRRLIPPPAGPDPEARAFLVFQLAQVLGWGSDELARRTPAQWASLVRELEAFGGVGRRRVFHLAYEIRFRNQTLDALCLHRRRKPAGPRFQIVTCLDEREESFRRHLEEVAPDCETFGAAGFFAVPMYYRGATDAHFVPLCPIVLTPKHWVEERAEESLEEQHRRLRRTQRVLGRAAHQAHVGTRSFVFGAFIAAFAGFLASVPLVARVVFPRLTARVRRSVGSMLYRSPKTKLALERTPVCEPGPSNGHLGFTLDEMAGMAERLLRDIGLIDGFSRLVFTVGHGSDSLNNPHKSAYDCGACGGSPGAPNGRTVATLLNDPRVRRVLDARGIHIPDTTWFVGGYHNTCDDSVTLFDLDRVPPTHRDELARVRAEFDRTVERNAHERCRRFVSAPLTMTFAEAKRHVEGRSEDLAQTRPELGHATNALCHVGRRERTRGLYFDRRMFLTSYDPTQDDENGTVLGRTMAAIFPVCGGINLEYYFSHIDPAGYGCGTKLPHNITSLLGVMDGAASDLRTGLPWQMTEIHEPVRLLIVCETTPPVMLRVLAGNPMGRQMSDNGWVRLAVQDPHSGEILLYEKGEFVPYKPQAARLPYAETSTDWYRGWRDHLEFAVIGPDPADKS